ncbi:cystathionine gamma-synthase family protein [Pontibacter sp. BT310]|uniref:Cystathionine gamma-synthase family protein n=1 Tax=Pontibacter populi TaxID=890055 RepID=A0ABS6X8R6_9BACT|nr:MULTISPECIES: cystathionine gamma-synthase family protein [Pontibacter]MBJ6117542.1 cystathionine gamma-synthase family protein [Pontibacter sp. BT310]MBR0569967.1 cystathionine gamma-synthase family protein [Microvirga sp. STS03]MBW3364395.1 cystathionine gamma-synthase family protein [Pontibacter populi]
MQLEEDHRGPHLNGKHLRPESLMMSYGYNPEWSEMAVKAPIYQTSTFVFKNAEEGKAFFELAYGLRTKDAEEQMGLIYSRLNNPDLEILENRLRFWDGAQDAAVFASGMAAISTMLLALLKPGDVILHSEPIYGGSDYYIKNILPKFGIQSIGFRANMEAHEVDELLVASGVADKLAMVYIETPANPTNHLVDIEACATLAKKYSTEDRKVIVAVDNTFLGPLFCHPLKHGADLLVYSATKYIGGHSDLIAGACLGSVELMKQVKAMRTFMGSMASPWTGWMLMRSLETLKIRMECQARGAETVAAYLKNHSKVDRIYYLGDLQENPHQQAIYEKQCLSAGSMISFDIKGGEKEAFTFLNNLKLIKLAVSLGGTESLAEHPASMTHSDISPADRAVMGIGEGMVRISVGVEHPDDIINDIEQALEKVPVSVNSYV